MAFLGEIGSPLHLRSLKSCQGNSTLNSFNVIYYVYRSHNSMNVQSNCIMNKAVVKGLMD